MVLIKRAELVICVLDGSISMRGIKSEQVKKTMGYLTKRMAESRVTDSFYLSIIYFAGNVKIVPLDDIGDKRIARFGYVYKKLYSENNGKIDEIFPTPTSRSGVKGDTNIAAALREAFHLAREFCDANSIIARAENLPNERYVTVILLTDGGHMVKKENPILEAEKMRNAQIRLVTVGLGRDAERYLNNLIEMASHIKDQTIINKLKNAKLDKYFIRYDKMCAYFPVVNNETGEALRELFHIVSSLSSTTGEFDRII
ncbi:MAG: VWA domain-containing protein [Candidatus Heimdallarchaeota archaeon]|nr:VWA domain-containing protein [Candidatus Heimdallarchaeota archaeon]